MEFFCTGLFGPIGRGCTRGDVEHAFGPPEDYSFSSKRSHADIWRYATIELHLHPSHALQSIFCDTFPIPECKAGVDIDRWIFGTRHDP